MRFSIEYVSKIYHEKTNISYPLTPCAYQRVSGTLNIWFHPWVEFAPVSGQTYLSVYMLNGGEISPLPLFRLCFQDRDEIQPGGNSAWF